uniref:Uncharacterized protein n=1 Tax=Psilocybe cubensis TaxID=181762 RepID=A0A8H7XUU1_PSICU
MHMADLLLCPLVPTLKPITTSYVPYFSLLLKQYVDEQAIQYSHTEVNAAAHRLVHDAIPNAPTYTSNRMRKGIRTYPKASSGFRPTEHAHDPAHGHDLAYHYPFHGRPGTPHQNPQGQNSMKVGSDRIMAWRNHGDSHFNIGVSYHDPKRPIPNNANARNHPFSHAPVKKGNATKVKALKAKKAVQRAWRKLKGNGGH